MREIACSLTALRRLARNSLVSPGTPTFIGGARPGAFCLNNWGDQAHTGPTFPGDAPVAGFWVDAAVVERMVKQGDSFALSDAVGFPVRKPNDWLIRANGRDEFANAESRDARRSEFALAP